MGFGRYGVFLSVLGILLSVSAGGKRSAKEWNSLSKHDWDAVEEQWTEGDHDSELRTEGQESYDMMQRKRKENLAVPPTAADNASPAAFAAASRRAQAGPTMMIATINMTMGSGARMTKEESDEVAYRWQRLAWSGGIDMSCFDAGREDQILVTLQKGWDGTELKDFLLAQPEVVEIVWDQVKYWPGGKPSLEKKREGAGGRGSRKKRRKKRQHKAKTGKKGKKGKKNKKGKKVKGSGGLPD
eukprot:g2213.t1